MAGLYGMAPVRRSQRIRGRQEEPINGSMPSVVPSADDPASTATATRIHVASTLTAKASTPKDAALPKAAPVSRSAAASKWALRPRKLTRGRLQAQGLATKRKHDELMTDLETASLQSQKTAHSSLKKSSDVLDAEARSEKYFSLQHSRCMQLVSKAPWRRYWRKMSLHEAFLRREARIRETLQKRESDLRDLWQKEVSAMRTKLAELQSQQAEGVKQLQAVQADRQAVTMERRQEEKKHDSAFAELQQKIQSLGGSAATTKVPTKVAPQRRATAKVLAKVAPRRRNRGWSHKPKPRKAPPASTASQSAEEPAEEPPSPRGPAPAKKPPASPKAPASTKRTGAMLEASPPAKTAKKTTSMLEASPPPARLPAQKGVPDLSPMSTQRSAMSPISPQGGSQGGSPLARSPPRSPSVPKCSAPFVEFVGAPVGKGSKVAGSMWPWPSEMMTRSRAKAL